MTGSSTASIFDNDRRTILLEKPALAAARGNREGVNPSFGNGKPADSAARVLGRP